MLIIHSIAITIQNPGRNTLNLFLKSYPTTCPSQVQLGYDVSEFLTYRSNYPSWNGLLMNEMTWMSRPSLVTMDIVWTVAHIFFLFFSHSFRSLLFFSFLFTFSFAHSLVVAVSSPLSVSYCSSEEFIRVIGEWVYLNSISNFGSTSWSSINW